MKKIYSIAALLLGFSICDMAYAAPDQNSGADTSIDDLFSYNTDDFDPTTAFINLDEYDDDDLMDVEGFNINDYSNVAVDVDVDQLISYAKNYLGRPYVWGSKGPNSFDCSGFTSFVFKKFNISLSPASRMQATQGVKIARNEIQPGDLLFFQGRRSSNIGHVALAINVDDSGDVTFIHAATGGVRIDKLSKVAYYQKRYICARRVIK